MISADDTPKDFIRRYGRWTVWSPSEGSDWTRRNMVRLKSVRKDVIGQDGRWSVWSPSKRIWFDETESGPYEDASKGIWLDETESGPYEDASEVIWLDETESGPYKDASEGIWLDETESGPYEDAYDLCVLPEWYNWTRRKMVRLMFLSSGNASDWLIRWICLLETLLIGWSDGSVFWCLLLTSFDFSFHDFIQWFTINKKRYVKCVFFLRRIRRSICRWRTKQTKRPSTYLLLTLPVVEF